MFVNVMSPIGDKKTPSRGGGQGQCSCAKIMAGFGRLGVNGIKKFSETQTKRTLQNSSTFTGRQRATRNEQKLRLQLSPRQELICSPQTERDQTQKNTSVFLSTLVVYTLFQNGSNTTFLLYLCASLPRLHLKNSKEILKTTFDSVTSDIDIL